MPEQEALSRNLKKIRKLRNISQEEFAAECGLSKEAISTLECEKGDPKLSTIQKVAAYTGCEVPELLKKDGNIEVQIQIENRRPYRRRR